MNHDWHVVSAVPACTSLEDAAKLKEVKERTGLRYMMAESSYYYQEAIHARNLYKEGILGEIFYILPGLGAFLTLLSLDNDSFRLLKHRMIIEPYIFDDPRRW